LQRESALREQRESALREQRESALREEHGRELRGPPRATVRAAGGARWGHWPHHDTILVAAAAGVFALNPVNGALIQLTEHDVRGIAVVPSLPG
jgi:hypothetical protein